MKIFKQDNPKKGCDIFLPVTVILETKEEYEDFMRHTPNYINNRVALIKNDDGSYFCLCQGCREFRRDEHSLT